MKIKLFNEKWVARSILLLIVIYIIVYGIYISNGFHFDNFDPIYLTILPLLFIVDGFKSISETLLKKIQYDGKENLEDISVIIPTYNGEHSLPIVLKDLLQRFKPENIIVSSNGSTDKTCDIARQFGVRLIDNKNPIGKVQAINAALEIVETPYVLTLDDDTLIGDIKLPSSLLEDKFDAIAFVVVPKPGNWITKIQAHEYKKSMEIGKVFHNQYASVQNISGAIGLFKTSELKRQVSIHTGEFSGEDLQRTLLIHLNKDSKGVVIQDSPVYTIVPDTITSLFNQRVYGWYPGFFANLNLYLRILFSKHTPITLKYDAVYNVFLVSLFDVFRFVALPVIIFYPGYFIVMYSVYVLLEAIAHYHIKIKEPFWVILIYPFFGIFGFITRVCAFFVFLYRRAVVFLKNIDFKDGYKNGKFIENFLGFLFVIEIAYSIILVYIAIIKQSI